MIHPSHVFIVLLHNMRHFKFHNSFFRFSFDFADWTSFVKIRNHRFVVHCPGTIGQLASLVPLGRCRMHSSTTIYFRTVPTPWTRIGAASLSRTASVDGLPFIDGQAGFKTNFSWRMWSTVRSLCKRSVEFWNNHWNVEIVLAGENEFLTLRLWLTGTSDLHSQTSIVADGEHVDSQKAKEFPETSCNRLRY